MLRNVTKRFICVFFVVALILGCFAVSAQTQQTTVIEMEEQEKSEYRSRLSLKSSYKGTKSYQDSLVHDFDADDSGRCVAVFDNGDIVVWDSLGEVSCVLSFDEKMLSTRSRSVYVKWEKENLELIFGYKVSFLITTEGSVLNVWRYESERHSWSIQAKKTVGIYTYELQGTNFAFRYLSGNCYNLITRTSDTGEVKTLFLSDIGIPKGAIFVIMFIVLAHIWALIFLCAIVSHRRKNKRKERDCCV